MMLGVEKSERTSESIGAVVKEGLVVEVGSATPFSLVEKESENRR